MFVLTEVGSMVNLEHIVEVKVEAQYSGTSRDITCYAVKAYENAINIESGVYRAEHLLQTFSYDEKELAHNYVKDMATAYSRGVSMFVSQKFQNRKQ